MSPSRTLILSLAAFGLVGIAGLGTASVRQGQAAANRGQSTASPLSSRLPLAAHPDQVVYFEPTPAPQSPPSKSHPTTLNVHDAAGLAEQSALRLLARDADLELTARQWAAFAAATAHIQTIRQNFEATLASVKLMPDGRYRMEIPAYATAGDALRTKLTAELVKQLGDETATEILAVLGSKLEGYFGGFGVSVQTLDFAASASPGAPEDFQVTRTVQYWNAVEGGAELRTRRETHFPGLEDPSGEAWQPFLARLSESKRGGAQRSG